MRSYRIVATATNRTTILNAVFNAPNRFNAIQQAMTRIAETYRADIARLTVAADGRPFRAPRRGDHAVGETAEG